MFVGAPGEISWVWWVKILQGSRFDPQIHERFDIIGMDRRGIGGSAPVRCFATETEMRSFYAKYPVFPTSRAEVRRVDALNDELRAGCERHSGSVVDHVSSADVARDLNLMRAAVGDSKLTFLGHSHAAYVGLIYAHLFPGRTRADMDHPSTTGGYSASAARRSVVAPHFGAFYAWYTPAGPTSPWANAPVPQG